MCCREDTHRLASTLSLFPDHESCGRRYSIWCIIIWRELETDPVSYNPEVFARVIRVRLPFDLFCHIEKPLQNYLHQDIRVESRIVAFVALFLHNRHTIPKPSLAVGLCPPIGIRALREGKNTPSLDYPLRSLPAHGLAESHTARPSKIRLRQSCSCQASCARY